MNFEIFTLCSNNYLAHAKTMLDSVRKVHPESNLIIGLVDRRDPGIDYSSLGDFEILDQESIGCQFFPEMLQRYDVVEFNTAVKPFYIEFLLKRSGNGSMLIYLDPDIFVYQPLDNIIERLKQFSIIITPNLINLSAEVTTGELASLRHGMFNLGFIAVRNTNDAMVFLKWWQNRLKEYCLIKKASGLFVDQKWIDLAPLYFNDIYILREPGYNMAWWNFSERKLLYSEGQYQVNDIATMLYFFHFSGFSPLIPRLTSRLERAQEISVEQEHILNNLFRNYSEKLILNGYKFYSSRKPLLIFHTRKQKSFLQRLVIRLRR
jgi:hypothetical protein